MVQNNLRRLRNFVNPYIISSIIHSRISEKQFREIIRLFCIDIEATKVSEIMGISRPNINRIFMAIRHRIGMDFEKESPFDEREIELDESYFGAKRMSRKRGRGAIGKIPVFEMHKHNGKVYTQVIKNYFLKKYYLLFKQKNLQRCFYLLIVLRLMMD